MLNSRLSSENSAIDFARPTTALLLMDDSTVDVTTGLYIELDNARLSNAASFCGRMNAYPGDLSSRTTKKFKCFSNRNAKR